MPRKHTPEQRTAAFWAKVNKADGCWLWTAPLDKDGYGGFRKDGETRVHRVAWQLAYGPIPAGLQVLHRCDVRSCVRPDHLFLGTNADNIADKMSKGRYGDGHSHIGTDSSFAVLDEDAVREIRRLYSVGDVTQMALASHYGVRRTAISKIVRRERWKHVA